MWLNGGWENKVLVMGLYFRTGAGPNSVEIQYWSCDCISVPVQAQFNLSDNQTVWGWTIVGAKRQGNVKFLVREMVASPDQTRAGIRWFLSGVS